MSERPCRALSELRMTVKILERQVAELKKGALGAGRNFKAEYLAEFESPRPHQLSFNFEVPGLDASAQPYLHFTD